MKNQGVVAVFKRDRFDRYSNFARIGDGSLGGKGRGLAFIDNMVKHHPEFDEFENARVAIPKTVVLCTDVFDEFMETNNLYQIALSDADDDVILRYFLKAKLPDRLVEDFFTFFDVSSEGLKRRLARGLKITWSIRLCLSRRPPNRMLHFSFFHSFCKKALPIFTVCLV